MARQLFCGLGSPTKQSSMGSQPRAGRRVHRSQDRAPLLPRPPRDRLPAARGPLRRQQHAPGPVFPAGRHHPQHALEGQDHRRRGRREGGHAKLRDLGARPLNCGEDPSRWLAEVLPAIGARWARHAGNGSHHVSEMTRPSRLPSPTRVPNRSRRCVRKRGTTEKPVGSSRGCRCRARCSRRSASLEGSATG